MCRVPLWDEAKATVRAICKLYVASEQLAQRLILFEIGNRLELLIYWYPGADPLSSAHVCSVRDRDQMNRHPPPYIFVCVILVPWSIFLCAPMKISAQMT